jgi:hypothetical protein
MIGLTLFTSISFFFRYQSDLFRERATDSYRKLLNTHLSTLIITLLDTCKECDFVNATIKVENSTLDYFYEFYLTSSGLNVSTQPLGKNYLSSIHNLNSTISSMSGKGVSVEPITLTFTKNQNKLEVE